MTAAERALPAGLRARVLEASWHARPKGLSVPEVTEISPAEALRRAADALQATLGALADEDWRRPALRDLDVQGLVGHLIGVESDLQRALAGSKEAGTAGHVESTQAAADRQAGHPPAQTLNEWHRAIEGTLALAATDDPARIVALHGVALPLSGMLVARAFELWTHENDIRKAAGLPAAVPDAQTLSLMTRLATSLLPFAAVRAGFNRTANVHLVLTGAGGGTWDLAVGDQRLPEPAQVSIVTDAAGFCRLAANRASPMDIEPHITGDPATAAGILAATATLALD